MKRTALKAPSLQQHPMYSLHALESTREEARRHVSLKGGKVYQFLLVWHLLVDVAVFWKLIFGTVRLEKKALEIFGQKHSPNAGLGINVLQEILAKTKITISAENTRSLWVPCYDPCHVNCGWASGMHISATDVGVSMRKIQEDIRKLVFGVEGIFRGVMIPMDIENQLGSLCNDVSEKKFGYCFMCHHANAMFTVQYRNFVTRAVESISMISATERANEIRKKLKVIEEVARLMTALIYLSNYNPPRGTEIGLHLVAN